MASSRGPCSGMRGGLLPWESRGEVAGEMGVGGDPATESGFILQAIEWVGVAWKETVPNLHFRK